MKTKTIWEFFIASFSHTICRYTYQVVAYVHAWAFLYFNAFDFFKVYIVRRISFDHRLTFFCHAWLLPVVIVVDLWLSNVYFSLFRVSYISMSYIFDYFYKALFLAMIGLITSQFVLKTVLNSSKDQNQTLNLIMTKTINLIH